MIYSNVGIMKEIKSYYIGSKEERFPAFTLGELTTGSREMVLPANVDERRINEGMNSGITVDITETGKPRIIESKIDDKDLYLLLSSDGGYADGYKIGHISIPKIHANEIDVLVKGSGTDGPLSQWDKTWECCLMKVPTDKDIMIRIRYSGHSLNDADYLLVHKGQVTCGNKEEIINICNRFNINCPALIEENYWTVTRLQQAEHFDIPEHQIKDTLLKYPEASEFFDDSVLSYEEREEFIKTEKLKKYTSSKSTHKEMSFEEMVFKEVEEIRKNSSMENTDENKIYNDWDKNKKVDLPDIKIHVDYSEGEDFSQDVASKIDKTLEMININVDASTQPFLSPIICEYTPIPEDDDDLSTAYDEYSIDKHFTIQPNEIGNENQISGIYYVTDIPEMLYECSLELFEKYDDGSIKTYLYDNETSERNSCLYFSAEKGQVFEEDIDIITHSYRLSNELSDKVIRYYRLDNEQGHADQIYKTNADKNLNVNLSYDTQSSNITEQENHIAKDFFGGENPDFSNVTPPKEGGDISSSELAMSAKEKMSQNKNNKERFTELDKQQMNHSNMEI